MTEARSGKGPLFWNGRICGKGGGRDDRLSVVLFSVQLSGLVRRGGLCRRAAEEVRQPGLFKRPPVPHLRLWGGAAGLPPAALWAQLRRAAGGQPGAGLRPGVAGGLFAGKALWPEVVGLLRPAPQSGGLRVPELLGGVGRGRGGAGAVRAAPGVPAGGPYPPHGEPGGAGDFRGPDPGGLYRDSGPDCGAEPEAEVPGVRLRQAAPGLGAAGP